MAKVYKVNTGITNPDNYSNESFRNIMFNILNSYFPGLLQKVDNSRELKSIAGIGLYNCGVGFRSYSPNVYCFNLYNGNQTDDTTIYNTNSSSGSLCIYHTPIKNGVLMSLCGSNDDYTKYMCYAFIKDSNNHVIFYLLKHNANTYEVITNDLMVNNSLIRYNPIPKAAPVIDSSKICMSKMILGDSILDVYVASVAPIPTVNAQAFIIDDKEYIAATQPNGYCPVVFRVD